MTEPVTPLDPFALASEACLAPIRDALSELDTHMSSGLRAALQRGLERHRHAIESSSLQGDPPAEWTERSEKLLAYRRAVGADLVEPLIAVFADGGPTAMVCEAVSTAVANAHEACRALPESLPVPWPEDALAALPEDGRGRRFAKGVARLVSSARKAGEMRDLPLRAVASTHLRQEVTPVLDTHAARVMHALAEWSGQLERALVEWVDGTLPLLVAAEESSDEPSDEVEDVIDVWRDIATRAETLQSQLEALAEALTPVLAPDGANAGLEAATLAALRADVTVAGSFLYRAQDPTVSPPTLRRATRIAPALASWEDAVAARLRMTVALLSIFSGATAIQRRLVWRFRERCLTSLRTLPDVADDLDRLADELQAQGPSTVSEARLAKFKEAVEEPLARALEALPTSADVSNTVVESSDSTVLALLAMISQAPATLVLHAEHGRPPKGARAVDTRTLPLQDLARQSFDAMRIERIRSSTEGLVEAVEQARTDIAEMPEVFDFAYSEAVRELTEGGAGGGDAALELVSDALRSVGTSLRAKVTEVDVAVSDAQGRLATEICAGSLTLMDRLAAGRMEAGLLAARSRVANVRAWINEHWGPPVEVGYRWLSARFARLRRLVNRLLRRGSAIVGTGAALEEDSTRSVRALADAQELIAGAPLVYQRLFTLEPLTDPALLAGRSRELTSANLHWSRWQVDDGVPLIVTGRPGSGVTTLMNVVGKQIEASGGTIRKISLAERVTDEGALAELLASGLDLPSCDSMDALATAVFDAPPKSVPDAVALDNLEHVYLRVPDGTALIERLLTLMTETEPRVFWVGGITTSAWQLVSVAEPAAVSQVDVLELKPLDAVGLREAVEVRRRRSGLPVRYVEPATGRRLLRRRLRRLRDPAAYGHLLQDDFFDRLFRSSSGHLRLALYQWLATADFETGEGIVMHTPERPDFAILESLDLTQKFTLKAFLEHRSLSLDEHDRIFRLPRHESYQIFEALGKRRLIEPVTRAADGTPKRSEVNDTLRYRVRPLLAGAVITTLRARNIVH